MTPDLIALIILCICFVVIQVARAYHDNPANKP